MVTCSVIDCGTTQRNNLEKSSFHSCSVFGCLNTTKNCDLSFFKFPNDIERRSLWLYLVDRKDIKNKCSKYLKVCETHFKTDSLRKTSNRTLLRKGSVPRLLLPVRKHENKGSQATVETTESYAQYEKVKYGSNRGNDEESSTDDATTSKPTKDRPDRSSCGKKLFQTLTDTPCAECRRTIYGFRLQCVECAEFEMCGPCGAKGRHPQHYVLRVPHDKPREEADRLVRVLRVELELEAAEEEAEEETEIKVEIKEELLDPLQEPVPEQLDPTRPHEGNVMEQSFITLDASAGFPKVEDMAPPQPGIAQGVLPPPGFAVVRPSPCGVAHPSGPTISLDGSRGTPMQILKAISVRPHSKPKKRSAPIPTPPLVKRPSVDHAATLMPSVSTEASGPVMVMPSTSTETSGHDTVMPTDQVKTEDGVQFEVYSHHSRTDKGNPFKKKT